MRKLIAGLLIIPSMALADSWSMPNKSGGEIVITDRECRHNGKPFSTLNQAYAYSNGSYTEGCWTVQDDMIKIIWNIVGGPETRVYDPKEFTLKSKEKKGGGV